MKFKEKQLTKESLRQVPFYLKDASNIEKIFQEEIDAIVYTFTKHINGAETLLALAFRGNSTKKNFYFKFRSEESRQNSVSKFFEKQVAALEYKKERREIKKKFKEANSKEIQVGTLLHGSWGYEQTNCEFYQVIEKPTKFKVVIREIGGKVVKNSEGHDCCELNPVKDSFTNKEPIAKLIGAHGISFEHFNLTPCKETDKFYSSWYY